jgi:hypothetical protein
MRAANNTPSTRWLRRALLAGPALALGMAATAILAGPSSHMGPHAQALSERSGTRSASSTQPTPEPVLEAFCATGSYRKNLLITQFSRRELSSANIGNLHQVENRLPELIAERLDDHPAMADIRLFNASLPDQSSTPGPRFAQQVRELAQAQRAQLVLSGEVIDMSMTRARDSHNPGLASRTRNSLVTALELPGHLDTRQRNFVFQLTLLDGLTGEVVVKRQYQSQGVWAPGRSHQVGFGSPLFWRTDYGQQVAGMLDRASAELAEVVSCQPLVATLDLRDGPDNVIVHSGADQRLSPGDTLRLYQVVVRAIPGVYQVYRTHLVDSDIDLEVRELHKNHSVGRLSGHLDARHGRYVAVSTEARKPSRDPIASAGP